MNNNFSSIRLEVTSKCNINCKYCHNSDYANKVDDMTTNEIEALIKSLKEQYPINKVLLTGGEPLLNTDIVQLVEFLTNMDIKVDMVTNGKLLNEELIQKLYNAGLKRIRLSIDGFEEHTEYRKGSNPYRLWELCKYIKNNTSMNLVVHTVCSPHNVDALERIYDEIVELGVDRWRVFDIGYSGEAVNNIELFGIAGYYENFIENVAVILEKYIGQNLKDKLDIEINGVFKTNLLENIYDTFKDVTPDQLLDSMLNVSPCDYINHQMTIRSNGKSTLCQYFHNTIFDFSEYKYNITEARVNANKTPESSLILSSLNHCRDCKYVVICNSGCRSKAEFLTGNILNPDPVACTIMPLIYDKIIPKLDYKSQKGFMRMLTGDVSPLYCVSDLNKFIQTKRGLSCK